MLLFIILFGTWLSCLSLPVFTHPPSPIHAFCPSLPLRCFLCIFLYECVRRIGNLILTRHSCLSIPVIANESKIALQDTHNKNTRTQKPYQFSHFFGLACCCWSRQADSDRHTEMQKERARRDVCYFGYMEKEGARVNQRQRICLGVGWLVQ
ncbi:hypothetical protein BKA57DRAFT_16951 [Linnemannia elongata]|nr:hypothetical protein BKA57DRAFT_16951 [Linnemannia elongata]